MPTSNRTTLRVLLGPAVLAAAAAARLCGAVGPVPPAAFPADNAATAAAQQAKDEMAALERSATANALPTQAQAAWRRVAFDLLFHGAGAEPQALAIAGFRMFDARAEFDALTERPSTGDDLDLAARRALQDFVDRCAHGLHPIPDAAAPEAILGEQLEPLRRAVALLETRKDPARPDAWPAENGTAAPVPSGTDTHFHHALHSAKWMGPEGRDQLARALAAPQPMASGCTEWAARGVEAATILQHAKDPWDAAKLRAAFAAIAESADAAAAERLARALEAASAVVAANTETMPVAVRHAAREVRTQALRASAALELLLVPLVKGDQKDTAAAVASAVAAQISAQRDLQRLEEAAAWSDRMGAFCGQARAPFERAVAGWISALAVPADRVAARARMDEFAAQLALFCPVRLEQRLRAHDEAAAAAAAGRSEELLAELDKRRNAWAMAWSRGSGGAAASPLLRLARTMDALATVSALTGRAPDARTLVRWGGLSVPLQGWGAHPASLTARAKLAVEGVLSGDDAAADAQLAALQRDVPVAWLAAAVEDQLGSWLEARSGVLAQLDAVCSGPVQGSWLGQERAALMQFSRVAREEARARGAGDAAAADTLRQRLAGLVQAMGSAMGGTPPAK